MKYIAGGIVAAAAIIGIILWLKGVPQEKMVEPTETPPKLDVASAPKDTTKQGETIRTTTKNGMTITTTKEGSGPAVENGQTALVEYTGKLDNGQVFDATSRHGGQAFAFTLGAGQVIKGWDQGVLGMKVGEERTLVIPADLAYGVGGIPGVIPQNATLTFDVKLVGIK